MKKKNKLLALILMSFVVAMIQGEVVAQEKTAQGKVRYKSSSRIDFESLLVEGEKKKPDMAVVTGNIGEKDSGLLKFRENFLDMMADSFGEEAK